MPIKNKKKTKGKVHYLDAVKIGVNRAGPDHAPHFRITGSNTPEARQKAEEVFNEWKAQGKIGVELVYKVGTGPITSINSWEEVPEEKLTHKKNRGYQA